VSWGCYLEGFCVDLEITPVIPCTACLMSEWMDVMTLHSRIILFDHYSHFKTLLPLFLHFSRIIGIFAYVCILLFWVVSAGVYARELPPSPYTGNVDPEV
jgi:hypothetical protein